MDLFLSISAKNHHILKISFSARLISLGLFDLKRRFSFHWKWNDRPFEARDLIISGIIKISSSIFSKSWIGELAAVPGSKPPVRTGRDLSSAPLPASNNISRAIPGQIQRSFRSISGRNHPIQKIFLPPPADFFVIIPLKRRLSSHWKWNDRHWKLGI